MMYLTENVKSKAQTATTLEDVRNLVQIAIEVEHATIPLYLAGYFSTLVGPHKDAVPNQKAADIVRSVVVEEMLHFSIASNLLIALGGKPAIDTPDFVPVYGKKLPFGIGEGISVDLKPLSKRQIHDVYMKIEEPEHGAIPITHKLLASAKEAVTYDTIGAFYHGIIGKLENLIQSGINPFAEPSGPQMLNTRWFPANELFEIKNIKTARAAIDVILDQGEGTTSSPFEHGTEEPAHYYRFEEIYEGYEIDPTPSAGNNYHFDKSKPVPFNEAEVVPFKTNPTLSDYKKSSASYSRAHRFAWGYSSLLRQLHATFNGEPDRIEDVMAQMYQLRIWAINCLETPATYAGGTAPDGEMTGLCFEFVAESGA